VIVRGKINERLEFFLVKKPLINLKKQKRGLFRLLKEIKALNCLIHFLLLELKEKSLYNIPFSKSVKRGVL